MSRHLVALIAALLLQQEAAAQRSRDIARQLVREGLELLDNRECAAALERFTRAQAVFPTSYKIDVNLGTALECLGRLTEAADHFDRFLDRADTVADHDMVVRVRKKLESLRLSLATVTVRDAEAGATITVDGREVGPAPLPRPLHLWPGQHRLTANRGKRSASMTLVLAAGARRTVSAAWPGTPSVTSSGASSSQGMRPVPPPGTQPGLAAVARAPLRGREPIRGLVISGAVTFGLTGTAGLVATIVLATYNDTTAGVFWIPVVGPIVAIPMEYHGSMEITLLVCWSLTQAAGAAMLVAGLVGHKRTATTAARDSWRVAPLVGAVNGIGVSHRF